MLMANRFAAYDKSEVTARVRTLLARRETDDKE
jgi:hypothetical protein